MAGASRLMGSVAHHRNGENSKPRKMLKKRGVYPRSAARCFTALFDLLVAYPLTLLLIGGRRLYHVTPITGCSNPTTLSLIILSRLAPRTSPNKLYAITQRLLGISRYVKKE